jgi:adenylate kinase
MRFRAILIFGAPGAGKGTQGRILGQIPGFYHMACGDVFRSLDLNSELGRVFLDYSSRGELVPDDFTIRLWTEHMDKVIALGRYKPEIDHLVLDGIPRNRRQAEQLETHLEVRKVFHLGSVDADYLVERMRRRALKENRLDDAREDVIRKRLEVHAEQEAQCLEFYGPDRVVEVDARQYPYEVLRDILARLDTSG